VRWRVELQYKAAVIFLLAAVFTGAGCGLFQTREPELPVNVSGVNPPATSPEMVLQNFISAVQLKNPDDYDKLFSDSLTSTRSFYFIPSADASVRYASVFARWSKANETQCFRNMISSLGQSASPTLSFLNTTIVPFQSDSAIISSEYLLVVPHNLATVTTIFTGRVEFYTAPDRNQSWSIYRWVDFTTKVDSSWSSCKGAFAP
jgi:hypothetical protein